MDENNLVAMAAFVKALNSEPLTLRDATRLWQIILENGLRIDTADENALNQFISELRGNAQRVIFGKAG